MYGCTQLRPMVDELGTMGCMACTMEKVCLLTLQCAPATKIVGQRIIRHYPIDISGKVVHIKTQATVPPPSPEHESDPDRGTIGQPPPAPLTQSQPGSRAGSEARSDAPAPQDVASSTARVGGLSETRGILEE